MSAHSEKIDEELTSGEEASRVRVQKKLKKKKKKKEKKVEEDTEERSEMRKKIMRGK